jgi:hypothetical protein
MKYIPLIFVLMLAVVLAVILMTGEKSFSDSTFVFAEGKV